MILEILGISTLLIYIGQKLNRKFKYYVMYTWFLTLMFCIISIPLPKMLLKGKNTKNGLWPCGINLFIIKRIFDIEIEITGLENMCKNGSVILLNHQSVVDCGGTVYISL